MQDMIYVSSGIILLLFVTGYMIYYRSLPKGAFLLLGLILLLSAAGLSDMTFRWNPRPIIILLADSLNIFCFAFALTILLHYSLFYFSKNRFWTKTKSYLALYIPALIISALHALSPLMIKGIISSPIGFQLSYNSGYWIIVVYGISLGLSIIFLNLATLVKSIPQSEKNQSIFLLFVITLLVYFYNSSIILPFLFRIVNFSSPLPTTFAIMVLVYGHVKYNYFALENIKEEASA